MAASPRWHERTLEDGEWLRADFGPISIVVQSIQEEWRVVVLRDQERDRIPAAGADLPDDLSWQRWDRGPKDTKLRFRPIFPDRPIIIRPRLPLNLSPRSRATFYVGIPAFIELSAHSEGSYATLDAWPTHRLSNTWHGSPLDGVLCYATKTRARRRFTPEDWKKYDIACTIEISNQSQNTLPFERLFFDTAHLAIFEHDDGLWSNHARIRTADKDADLNGVVFGPRPLGEASEGLEISAPREGVARRGIFKQAFSTVLSTFQDD